MVVARILVLLAIICTSRTAWAFEADRVCTLENGRRVRIDDELCRPIGGQLTPSPSPSPTPSVRPTPVALPCESILGVKIFTAGEPRMFCFDIGQGGSAIVEVASTTPANNGCSYFRSQLTAPDGTKANTDGAYPMAATWRMPGRYYFWVDPLLIGEGLCSTYSFTVSK